MIEIPLSKKGKYSGLFVALIDYDDEILASLNWSVSFCGGHPYAKCEGMGYLHRVVLERKLEIKLLRSDRVDHVHGNTLDNRREEIRKATHQENTYNAKLSVVNTSGFRGVSWHKPRQKWVARINAGGKEIALGYFTNFDDAVTARINGELKYHGDFASIKGVNDEYGKRD